MQNARFEAGCWRIEDSSRTQRVSANPPTEAALAAAYPKASLGALSGAEDCTRLDAAESWLIEAAAKWRRELRREPGFEPVTGPLRVCALAQGPPYSDQQRARIFVRGWRSLEDRMTLAHEYLHIAFRFHPNGADEAYIERLARRLVGS